jgi:hypothetical protein
MVMVSFIGGANKTTKRKQRASELLQVNDKMYHKMLYRVHLIMSGILNSQP